MGFNVWAGTNMALAIIVFFPLFSVFGQAIHMDDLLAEGNSFGVELRRQKSDYPWGYGKMTTLSGNYTVWTEFNINRELRLSVKYPMSIYYYNGSSNWPDYGFITKSAVPGNQGNINAANSASDNGWHLGNPYLGLRYKIVNGPKDKLSVGSGIYLPLAGDKLDFYLNNRRTLSTDYFEYLKFDHNYWGYNFKLTYYHKFQNLYFGLEVRPEIYISRDDYELPYAYPPIKNSLPNYTSWRYGATAGFDIWKFLAAYGEYAGRKNAGRYVYEKYEYTVVFGGKLILPVITLIGYVELPTGIDYIEDKVYGFGLNMHI